MTQLPRSSRPTPESGAPDIHASTTRDEDSMTDVTTPETIRYTADIAVVRGDDLLLIERGWDPHKGQLALPGGHVDAGETSRQAAARELAEETGIVCDPEELEFVGLWDEPERDPRGRYVTAVYSLTVASHTQAHAGDDAVNIEWAPLHEHDQLRGLAFDHADIAFRIWRRELDRMTASYERMDALEGAGDTEELSAAFHAALTALSHLRREQGDLADWARAVSALHVDFLPRLGGILDAVVRAHASEGGSMANLANAMGVPRSTAQYRRQVLLASAPSVWEAWATDGPDLQCEACGHHGRDDDPLVLTNAGDGPLIHRSHARELDPDRCPCGCLRTDHKGIDGFECPCRNCGPGGLGDED